MLFKPMFQTIATLKIGNIQSFASNEVTSLFGGVEEESKAEKLMGNISASAPPIDKDRYASPDERLFSVNFIKKITETATLRGNVDYSYSKSRYDYDIQRNFYDGDENIIIDQGINSLSTSHSPSFSIVYKNNAATSYLNNTLFGKATFLRNELPTMENSQELMQQQSMRDSMWEMISHIAGTKGNCAGACFHPFCYSIRPRLVLLWQTEKMTFIKTQIV